MVTWLNNATKRNIIQVLRDIMGEHPRYRGDKDNVQNKFSFDERPSRGIIVNGTSADRVVLSADNYMGREKSFVMHAPANGKNGNTVEWVRENANVLAQKSANSSLFPAAPGAYSFKVLSVPDDARNIPGTLSVTPNFTVYGDDLITIRYPDAAEAQLNRTNIYEDSLRLYLDGRILLKPDFDYTVDYTSGLITFKREMPEGIEVTADYRYSAPTVSPVFFKREEFKVDIIEGAVIAFGDRCEVDDEFVIVVTEDRAETADVFGGKFEIDFDLIAFSKDAEDREKLADYITMSVMNRQIKLSNMGMELLEIAPGGENEDIYNNETDSYYYETNLRLRLRVEWSTYIPLPMVLSDASASRLVPGSETLTGSRSSSLEASVFNSAAVRVGNSFTTERIM